MNIRKSAGYGKLFQSLCEVMERGLGQMELYCEIGKLVAISDDKGAVAAAADYVSQTYPDAIGFSARNIRRMRCFYNAYASSPALMRFAVQIGWTRNVAILDAALGSEEQKWYLRAAQQFGWSKQELARQIKERAHEKYTLDTAEESCYTEPAERAGITDDESALCLSGEHLPQSDGGVRAEGHGEEGRTREGFPDRVRRDERYQQRAAGVPRGEGQTARAWDRLFRKAGAADAAERLCSLRPADRDGPGEPPQYAAHLRRRSRRKDSLAAGFYQPSR